MCFKKWGIQIDPAHPYCPHFPPICHTPYDRPDGGDWVGGCRCRLGEEIGAAQVRDAIRKGVDYLKSRQQSDGSWSDWHQYSGGVTALCTLALLNAGVPVDDPVVERALNRLRKITPTTTYVASLQAMVFCKADPRRDLMLIANNVRLLEKWQNTSGVKKGAWAYPTGGFGGDNSNSQFALLALYEAEQAGADVQPQVWRLAKTYWEECQNANGSWGYLPGLGGTGSMTAAGITSMVIVDDKVNLSEAQATGDPAKCCLGGREPSSPIDRALGWLGRPQRLFRLRESGRPHTAGHLALDVLLPVRTGARGPNDRPSLHRRPRLVSGRGRLSDPQPGPAFRLLAGSANAESQPEVATALALCFCRKGAGRCCWPS